MAAFNGVINVDVRDSVQDWGPWTQPSAPAGSPNILIVLYDDTGLAAWSPYGGRIEMPTMQRLADGGLTYTQWHTTALCSPTRSCILTGRNHHQNGYACIAEGATGLPRVERVHPEGERVPGRGAAPARLQHVLGRQEPQRAVRCVGHGRLEVGVAAGARVRPLLRVHRRRDRPVVSEPRRRQPLRRAAVRPRRTATTCRRTSPTRR